MFGRPIVSTLAGGIPEVRRAGRERAARAEPGDPASLATALRIASRPTRTCAGGWARARASSFSSTTRSARSPARCASCSPRRSPRTARTPHRRRRRSHSPPRSPSASGRAAAAREGIERLERSRSWRLTAPLRRAAAALRRALTRGAERTFAASTSPAAAAPNASAITGTPPLGSSDRTEPVATPSTMSHAASAVHQPAADAASPRRAARIAASPSTRSRAPSARSATWPPGVSASVADPRLTGRDRRDEQRGTDRRASALEQADRGAGAHSRATRSRRAGC